MMKNVKEIVDSNTKLKLWKKIDIISEKVESLSDSKYKDILSTILDNMRIIQNKYPEFFDSCFTDGFRYNDYYDDENSIRQSIEFFQQTYLEKDADSRLIEFAMFIFILHLNDLFETFDFEFDDLCTILDVDNYYEKLLNLSEFILNILVDSKWNPNNKNDNSLNELPFLNNRYKVFFTGLSLKDIKDLNASEKMLLINKLNRELSTETVIPLTEGVDHVREAYDFPIQRIHFLNDYRIAFIRIYDVTVILGIARKTGKDIDYTRYDSVAEKKKTIYKEVENFINGTLSEDSQHYKVIQLLEKVYKKKKQSKK